VKKERSAMMDKARAKKKRRDQTKLAKTIARKPAPRLEGAPIQGVVQKVVDVVQEAALEVRAVAKAAAVKITSASMF
jgi:hypothetical protein